jgi:anti-sigma factor RsiW
MPKGCSQARENLDRFLDNDLSGREATDIAAHLDTCAACHHEFENQRAMRTALRQFAATTDGAVEARDRVFARLEQQVRAEKQAPSRRGFRLTSSAWMGWFSTHVAHSAVATVTAAAFVAGAVFLMNRPQEVQTPGGVVELPGPAEIELMFALHDAHVGGLTGDDPILRRSQTAEAHAEFMDRANETLSGNL